MKKPTGRHSNRPLMKDFCTAVPDFDFGHACAIHDRDYGAGGNKASRREADKRLRRAIWAQSKKKPVWQTPFYWAAGWVYYAGVRLFGKSHYTMRDEG